MLPDFSRIIRAFIDRDEGKGIGRNEYRRELIRLQWVRADNAGTAVFPALTEDLLQKVAGEFRRRVHASGSSGWRSVWNDLDWYGLCSDGKVFSSGGGADMQMTGNTDEMWDADRKFLYGFWRDCFEAKQQLFLVFIRAEPLLLGGGTADQLPPQLGARAVALVWRDPSTSSGAAGGYPHRTRLLFYRPLD